MYAGGERCHAAVSVHVRDRRGDGRMFWGASWDGLTFQADWPPAYTCARAQSKAHGCTSTLCHAYVCTQ
eukprot:5423905-Pleurochrysis_carterae.AAC.1